MSAINSFVRQAMNEQAIEALAWCLIHFLWQGLAIAAMVGLLLWLLRSARPATRYAVGLSGLIAMSACPIVTLTCFNPIPTALQVADEPTTTTSQSVNPESIAISADVLPAAASAPPIAQPLNLLSQSGFPLPEKETAQDFQHTDNSSQAAIAQAPSNVTENGSLSLASDFLSTQAPRWIVGIWLVGVGLFGLRLLLSWLGVWRLRTQVAAVPQAIAAKTEQLAKVMRVAQPLIRTSQRVTQAIAVGFFKPMILLPASWLTELSPEMLETIIAHELAHIRRRDLWVNLFQRVVEAFLFYHPAMWWLSRRVRIERELCCDAMVVEATQDRLLYAETLEHVGRLSLARSADRQLDQAALSVQSVGSRNILLTRIRSILQAPDQRVSPSWPAVAAILAVGCLLLVFMQRSTSGSSTISDSDSEGFVMLSNNVQRYKTPLGEIEVSIKPEKSEIMVGEPTSLVFTVKNLSDQDLYELEPGLWVNGIGANGYPGRPESCQLTATDPAGAELNVLEYGASRGMTSARNLVAPGKTWSKKMFLPFWFEMDEVGKYTIRCRVKMKIGTFDDPIYATQPKRSADTDVDLTVPLELVPYDDQKMGQLIDSLGQSIVDDRRLFNDGSNGSVVEQLSVIEDLRVVKYFVQTVSELDRSTRFHSLRVLAKHNSDEALRGIEIGLATTGADMRPGSTTDEVAESSAESIRHSAALALSRSPHPKAKTRLLSLLDDSNDAVRLTAVQCLGDQKDPGSLNRLKQMTSDSNEYVRSEAIRYIKELQQDMEDADPEVSTKTSANAKDGFSIEQFAEMLKPKLAKGWSVAINGNKLTIQRAEETLLMSYYGVRGQHRGETDEEYYKDMGFNSTLDVELRFEPRLSNEAWLELSARTADLIESAKDGFRSKMEMSEHAVLSDKYQLPDFETADYSIFQSASALYFHIVDKQADQELKEVVAIVEKALPANRGIIADESRPEIRWPYVWINSERDTSLSINKAKAQPLTTQQALERFNRDAKLGFLNPQWAQTIDWTDVPDSDGWMKLQADRMAALTRQFGYRPEGIAAKPASDTNPYAQVVRFSKQQVEVAVARDVGSRSGQSHYGVAKLFRIPRSPEVDAVLGLAKIEVAFLTTYKDIGKGYDRERVLEQLGKPDYTREFEYGGKYDYYFDEDLTLFYRSSLLHRLASGVPTQIKEEAKQKPNKTEPPAANTNFQPKRFEAQTEWDKKRNFGSPKWDEPDSDGVGPKKGR